MDDDDEDDDDDGDDDNDDDDRVRLAFFSLVYPPVTLVPYGP